MEEDIKDGIMFGMKIGSIGMLLSFIGYGTCTISDQQDQIRDLERKLAAPIVCDVKSVDESLAEQPNIYQTSEGVYIKVNCKHDYK